MAGPGDDCSAASPTLRQVRTDELSSADRRAIRELLDAAFADDDEEEPFSEEDWLHALGGTHFIVEVGGEVRAHASVVERELRVAGRPLRTGYVEAVATAPGYQRSGLGTLVMRAVGAYLEAHFELGALGTGHHAFYERLGWRTWRGPTSVRTASGEQLTPEEDGYIMVLPTPRTPAIELTLPISCDWRPGDVW